jgi:YD repeat-containing protein
VVCWHDVRDWVDCRGVGCFGNDRGHEQLLLDRTHIRERGTLTLAREGQLRLSEGATLDNAGTFKANQEAYIVNNGGSQPLILNTGLFEKTEGSWGLEIAPDFENHGTVEAASGTFDLLGGGSSNSAGKWIAAEGKSISFQKATFSLTNSSLSGSIEVSGTVEMEGVSASSAGLAVPSGTVSVLSGSMTVHGLTVTGGTLTGAGAMHVSSSFSWTIGTMSGTGSTVVGAGVSGSLGGNTSFFLVGRTLDNEGTLTLTPEGQLRLSEGATLDNAGTFKANEEAYVVNNGGSEPAIVNTGLFEKTEGSWTLEIQPNFANDGQIRELAGSLKFLHPVSVEGSTHYGGAENPDQPQAECGDPVSCATGNFTETQTDFAIGGRGVGLDLTRTYNSQAAAEGTKGAFGYGWSASFSDHLVVEKAAKTAVLHQADGSTVSFTEGSGESFVAPVWTQDTLSGSEASGYTLTLADQVKYKFAKTGGRLESVTDRDGNATTLTYNEAGQLTAVTDPVGRKIKLTYNGEGLVESAEDPMGHVVKYTYEGGNLKSVTQPAEASLRWQFKYDGSHGITEMVDGRSGKTINEYNGSHQLTEQTDPAEHKLKFEYEPFHTTITNETTGSVTSEWFTSNDEPASIIRGYGTASATTEALTYNEAGYVTSVTDGDGYTTKYGYDSANDRTSMVDPDEDETKWTYDSTHDVETITTPKGETTTIKREAHGNPEVIERPAPGSKTQTTKYKYAAHGELESVTNPLEHSWKYEYDSKGDRNAETDPEGNKRTWEYNEDSQETATVSPRGNAKGAEPSKFTTKIERNAKGLPVKVTDPLGHTTEYKYDGDGNLEKLTDGNKHTTTYTYNADNEPTKVEEPNKAVTETEYDGAGQVIAQIDGDKHKTK